MNLKFSKRTLLLAGLNAVLALVLVIQLVSSRPASVIEAALDVSPDSLVIELPGREPVSLEKRGEDWFVGRESWPADNKKAVALAEKLSSLTVLDSVGGKSDAGRYDLTENSAKKVTLYSEGKVIRTLRLGKESATTSQSFLQMDNSDDILLVSGSFSREVDVTADDLRDKALYALKEEDVLAVEISGEESFRVVKNGKTGEWELSGASVVLVQPDYLPLQDKMDSWIRSLLNLNASAYPVPEPSLDGKGLGRMVITTDQGEKAVTVYEKRGEDYLCVMDGNPYPFTLTSWSAEKMLKKTADFYPVAE